MAAPRRATVEAGMLNLDFLWPRRAPSNSSLNLLFRRQRVGRGNVRPEILFASQRSASTDGRGWLGHLWGSNQKTPRPLKSDDLPLGRFLDDGGDPPMFNPGRKMSPKSANEAKLRCTEFDENGNVVLVNGEFKKSELIAKVRKSLKFW
jgi:magnesium transporter